MPPRARGAYVRRRIGREGIVRRVPQAVREATYEALITAGQQARKEYRTALKERKRSGLTAKSVRMKRNKRRMIVRVGIFPKEHQINKDDRGVSPAQKAKWLEFGTKRGGKEYQKPRPTLLPIYENVSKRVPQHIRDEWNKHADKAFARFQSSLRIEALRRKIKL